MEPALPRPPRGGSTRIGSRGGSSSPLQASGTAASSSLGRSARSAWMRELDPPATTGRSPLAAIEATAVAPWERKEDGGSVSASGGTAPRRRCATPWRSARAIFNRATSITATPFCFLTSFRLSRAGFMLQIGCRPPVPRRRAPASFPPTPKAKEKRH